MLVGSVWLPQISVFKTPKQTNSKSGPQSQCCQSWQRGSWHRAHIGTGWLCFQCPRCVMLLSASVKLPMPSSHSPPRKRFRGWPLIADLRLRAQQAFNPFPGVAHSVDAAQHTYRQVAEIRYSFACSDPLSKGGRGRNPLEGTPFRGFVWLCRSINRRSSHKKKHNSPSFSDSACVRRICTVRERGSDCQQRRAVGTIVV